MGTRGEGMPRRRWSYALLAMLLSTGAPLGLVALRALRAGTASPRWIHGEVSSDAATYLYVTGGDGRGLPALRPCTRPAGRPPASRLSRADAADRTAECPRVPGAAWPRKIARVRRHGRPLSLLLIDVDRLKEINDREGHRGGDHALLHVARALRQAARGTDLAAR